MVCLGIGLFTYHKYRKSIESPIPLDAHGNPILDMVEDPSRDLHSFGVELEETVRLTEEMEDDDEDEVREHSDFMVKSSLMSADARIIVVVLFRGQLFYFRQVEMMTRKSSAAFVLPNSGGTPKHRMTRPLQANWQIKPMFLKREIDSLVQKIGMIIILSASLDVTLYCTVLGNRRGGCWKARSHICIFSLSEKFVMWGV